MVRRIVRKLAISASSLVLVLGGAELICRAAGLGPKPGAFRWAGDDRVGFAPMPNQQTSFGPGNPESGKPAIPIRINQFGQRGEDFPLVKPAGEWRVAIVGDSLTMGQDVLDDECYPARLQKILRGSDGNARDVRVVNAAVNGWHTWNYAQWTEYRMPDYDVDLLVVGLYLGNDMAPAAEGSGVIPVPLHSLLRDSALYHRLVVLYRDLLWMRVEAQRRGKSMTELEKMLEQFKGMAESDLSEEDKRLLWERNAIPQLLRIRDASREQGVPVVVLLIPTWGLVAGKSTDEIHEFLRTELEAHGVMVATCLEELRAVGRSGWLQWDPGHLSALGNDVVANTLARQLPQP